MSLRRTLWTGVSSYGQLASVTITTLLSVPLALRFLNAQEFGLWSFASQAVGYLMLIDLGVSGSISRMMVEPLSSGRQEEIDRWFSLSLAILATQAALLLVVGLPSVGAIVRWFEIPLALRADASRLLSLLIITNALAHPVRVCSGILFAQNRAYVANAAQMVGVWVNFAAFAALLLLGFRSLSYGVAAAIMTGVQCIFAVVAIVRGPNQFHLRKVKLWSPESLDLFRFSSGLFFVGIGVQIVLISQSLILTKFAGLAAVASFNVSTRVGMLLMQVLWRPFDSFAPRWQQLFVQRECPRLSKEFLAVLRLTLGLTFVGVVFLAALNGLFVGIWARSDLYLGRRFDLLFGGYLVVQTINHCLSHPFVLAKETRKLALISSLEALVNLTGTVWAVRRFGPQGLIAASIAATVMTSFFWIIRAGPRQIGLKTRAVLNGCRSLAPLVFLVLLSGALGFLPVPLQRWGEVLLCATAVPLLIHALKHELDYLGKLISARANK